MKLTKAILFFFFLSFFQTSFAQEKARISVAYDDTWIGSNFNVTYHRKVLNSFFVYGGLKYFVASRYGQTEYASRMLHKQFEAEEPIERLGLKLGLEKTILKPIPSASVFTFFDFQYTNVTNRFRTMYYNWKDQQLWELYDNRWGPVDVFENYVGMGLRFNVYKMFNFKVQGGVGYNYFRGPEIDYKHNHIVVPHKGWELSRMFGFGIEYNFKNNKKS